MVSERFEEPQVRKMPKYEKLPIHARANFENLKIWALFENHKFELGAPKTCPDYGLAPYKLWLRQLNNWTGRNLSNSKIKEIIFWKIKNHCSLSFWVIKKSFSTHSEQGLMIIRIHFKIAISKNVGSVAFSARNFKIIAHFGKTLFWR